MNSYNEEVTYENLLTHEEIEDMLEVYMDDMIVKSSHEPNRVQKYNMRIIHEKCTFAVKAGKFLDFYLNE